MARRSVNPYAYSEQEGGLPLCTNTRLLVRGQWAASRLISVVSGFSNQVSPAGLSTLSGQTRTGSQR